MEFLQNYLEAFSEIGTKQLQTPRQDDVKINLTLDPLITFLKEAMSNPEKFDNKLLFKYKSNDLNWRMIPLLHPDWHFNMIDFVPNFPIWYETVSVAEGQDCHKHHPKFIKCRTNHDVLAGYHHLHRHQHKLYISWSRAQVRENLTFRVCHKIFQNASEWKCWP